MVSLGLLLRHDNLTQKALKAGAIAESFFGSRPQLRILGCMLLFILWASQSFSGGGTLRLELLT